ncbi:Rossmann-fold NAD(P)-binding domain-containing protein [Furfurilactobacillus rossiae]|uniref:hypothetical protein n=1 Tax=Furfurilactobacillus rossiae TaxID=231049 RepID=UPI00035D55F5|nr:hypothetical protein [Furfurilactobacillus rossiae]QFR66047.1 hypothetical protein LR814_02520 [Furfurilactobacillus rossiae]QLE61471.1 L-lactate dehydrogenase [Furfurilactobacillus rossiae]
MKPNVVLYGTGRFNQLLLSSLIALDLPIGMAVMDSGDVAADQLYADTQVAAEGCTNLNVKIATQTDLVTADAIIFGDIAQMEAGTERDDALSVVMPRLRNFIREAMAQGFKGKMIVASQYDDLLTYFAQKFSGVGVSNCIGVGTLAHTTILNNTLARTFNVPLDSLHAYVVGIANDHLIAWSRSTVGPAPVLSLMANEDIDFDAAELGEIEQQLNATAISTNDALRAQSVIKILRGIFFDRPFIGSLTNLLTIIEERVTPLSTPVRVNAAGVSKLVDVSYSDLEQRQLDEIGSQVRDNTLAIEKGSLEEDDDEDEH